MIDGNSEQSANTDVVPSEEGKRLLSGFQISPMARPWEEVRGAVFQFEQRKERMRPFEAAKHHAQLFGEVSVYADLGRREAQEFVDVLRMIGYELHAALSPEWVAATRPEFERPQYLVGLPDGQIPSSEDLQRLCSAVLANGGSIPGGVVQGDQWTVQADENGCVVVQVGGVVIAERTVSEVRHAIVDAGFVIRYEYATPFRERSDEPEAGDAVSCFTINPHCVEIAFPFGSVFVQRQTSESFTKQSTVSLVEQDMRVDDVIECVRRLAQASRLPVTDDLAAEIRESCEALEIRQYDPMVAN